MRVGFISTYPPIECGIATYTQYLTNALAKLNTDIYIISHYGANGKNVFPTFDYNDPDFATKTYSMMVRFTPDIVHIQHEFALYSGKFGTNVIPLILNFKLSEIPVVTTMHTVYSDMSKEHKIITEAILYSSDKIIVHENYQKETIEQLFNIDLSKKVVVIPHGARNIELIVNAKKELHLPEDKIALLQIGYFRPSKNFEITIEVFNQLAEKYKNIILIIAGKVRGIEHKDYRDKLFNLIEQSPFKDRIYLIRGQLSQKAFDTVLSASDIVILPYKINSQSGILAHCLAFGKPVITSQTPSMVQTLAKSKSGFACNSFEEYLEKTSMLIDNEQLRKDMSKNAKDYVKNHISWDIIAKLHLDLYESLTRTPIHHPHIITLD
ncbi:glycosyltransferase [Deferribacter autotrophicus]|uniref:Glycosyltransferase n=1 Tax=Deferribacter autotrophicus TaxID=500465 RepID=A0A5A8F6Y0_9BACT|nr:glycosyltransferase [Deferribacter autotrophicus]KAA0258629.1 glycosyltransferase [Deferribacter autotrophicus]